MIRSKNKLKNAFVSVFSERSVGLPTTIVYFDFSPGNPDV